MEGENPYLPPCADPVVPVEPVECPPLAGLGRRFVGALIDGILEGAIMLSLVFALEWLGVWSFVEHPADVWLTPLAVIVSFVIYMVLNLKFLATSGQTIGKRVAKTRMVTMDGRLPTLRDLILKRYGL